MIALPCVNIHSLYTYQIVLNLHHSGHLCIADESCLLPSDDTLIAVNILILTEVAVSIALCITDRSIYDAFVIYKDTIQYCPVHINNKV